MNSIEALRKLTDIFPGQVIFSTSLGYENQVITDLTATNNLPVRLFTLDTGRMFGETYSVWNRTLIRYGLPIQTMYPKQQAVEQLLTAKGPNIMYESVENRRECCGIRKVEPLSRALAGQNLDHRYPRRAIDEPPRYDATGVGRSASTF